MAGEDSNDRKCLRLIIEALCEQAKGRIVEINASIRLRAASQDNLVARVDKIVSLARARAIKEGSEIAAVFVHEDYDEVDSATRDTVRNRVQAALDSAMVGGHYILATWEIEAWLLLFPAALTGLVGSWSVPKRYQNRDTGKIRDPKRILSEEVTRGGSRRYRESDSYQVIERAAKLSLLRWPCGTNRSWSELVKCVEAWCRGNITSESGAAR